MPAKPLAIAPPYDMQEQTLVPIDQTARPLFAWLMLIALSACAPHSKDDHVAGSPLLGIGEPRIVATGLVSTEGPVWNAGTQSLLFSDIPADRVYSFDPVSGRLSVLRTPSSNANGLALDAQSYLLAAEQTSRTISRMNPRTGDVQPFISTFEDEGGLRAFNSPNDMAVHPNGSVYFTDPPFGLQGRTRELHFNGLFVRTSANKIRVLRRFASNENPNGIAFSPDYTILYVAVSHDVSGPILAYDVGQDGSLSNEREFARGQNTDGMKTDSRGNLYVATRTGIRVWAPDGRDWGMIRLPGDLRTTNCAFGGKDLRTLYITSRSSELYAVELRVPGHR